MAGTVALKYLGLLAFGKASDNIVGREIDLFPTRMFLLGKALSVETVPLTWGILTKINKPWGSSTTETYTDTSCTYHWKPLLGIFTITDTAGVVTTRTGIYTVEDLEVSWGVMPNIIATIGILDGTNAKVFLSGCHVVNTKNARQESFNWWDTEYLAAGTQHAIFNRISQYDSYKTYSVSRAYIGIEPEYNPLLLQTGGLWQATNNYSVDLISQDTNLSSERSKTAKIAALNNNDDYLIVANISGNLVSNSNVVYEPAMLLEWISSLSAKRSEQPRTAVFKALDYLLIAEFAKLSSDSDITYEPWMLWQIFQWYLKDVSIVANSRRIFDLSPRWG